MTALQDRPQRTPADRPSAVRSLLGVALGPALTVVAVLTAGVLVVLVAGGIDLRGTAAVVAAAWLGAHLVPLTITGTTLGVLPLLPTALLVWTTERSVAATGARGRRCSWVAGAAVLGPVLLTLLAVAVLALAPAGLPVAAPDAAGALVRVALVHALGSALGLARPSGQLARVRRALPGWAWSGLVRVPELLAVLAAAGTVLTTLALVRGLATVSDLVGAGGGAGGALGLVVLSTAYLPNVAVGAVSVAVGPGAVLGTSTVTAFGAVGGPVPALPVLAVLPASSGAWWWPVVLVVPAAVAGLLGWRAVRSGAQRGDALRAVGMAALVTGLVVGVLGAVSGGALGAFSPVGVPALALAAATVVWLAVVGGATVLALERGDTAADEAAVGDEAVVGAADEVAVPAADDVVESDAAGTDDPAGGSDPAEADESAVADDAAGAPDQAVEPDVGSDVAPAVEDESPVVADEAGVTVESPDAGAVDAGDAGAGDADTPAGRPEARD